MRFFLNFDLGDCGPADPLFLGAPLVVAKNEARCPSGIETL